MRKVSISAQRLMVARLDASGQEYWPGSHVRRMQQRLAAWQREAALPS